jgi:hypothetical protein
MTPINIIYRSETSLMGRWNTSVFSGAGLVLVCLLLLARPAHAVDVLMHHNDLSRTGANLEETVLTPANVIESQFGKLFSQSVDGKVYAQPLYVSGLTIGGQTRNVIFVCTDNNSVYAFDADNGSDAALWHVNLGTPVPSSDVGSCSDMSPQIGITGTPAIDKAGGTIYLDAKTTSSGGYFQKLHALDLTTGAEKFGGAVTISGSVNGKTFSAQRQHQRPGLVLLNGVVYLAFGSHCDMETYYGWLIGYNMTNLQQVTIFNTTPIGSEGAIWSSGMAPAVDASGHIYVMVGNGSFNANTGGANYGESFLKFNTTGGILSVADWFCPSNQAALSSSDFDVGSGGPVLIPGTSLIVGTGKEGIVYLVDQNNMGHYSTSTNNIVQQFKPDSETDRVGPSPVYWQGPADQYLYFSAGGNKTKVFTFNGSKIDTTAAAQSSETQGNPGGISLSANGTAEGILWVVDDGSGGTLRAYDAAGTLTETWNSQDNSSRDSLGTYVKFVSPTIANGKVYVGTDGGLVAYGLLNAQTNFVGTNEIQCVASGLAVDVSGAATTNGAPVIQSPFGGSASSLWTFIATSNGYYQVNNVNSKKDMVVQSASTASGAKIIQWSFGSSGDDQWKPVLNADGTYTFFNLHSGLVLDDPGGSTTQGTQFDQASPSGGSNQELNIILNGVTTPDFSLSASPASQTVTAGNGTSYTATVSALNGFSGDVALSVSGLPSGASGNFNPASVTGSGSSTLSVTTGTNTPPGTYTLTIMGTSGSLSHSTTAALTVNSGTNTLAFQAQNLSYTTNGAIAALQTDTHFPGGHWVALEATKVGPYIEFTLPNIPAGTYQLQLEWKGNNTRGILSLSVDGTTLGSTLDQYSATQTYPTTTFGNVTLTSGNHLVRLTVTGKNSASSNYWLSAYQFTLTGQ